MDGYRLRFGGDAGGDGVGLEFLMNNAGTAIFSLSGAVTNGITDYGFLVRVVRSLSGTWTLYTSTLPVQTGTGAIATDPPDDAHASITQGSVTNSTFTNFDGGFVGIEAFHTSAAAAR